MGDGVNIAARLEGIAQPGGICLSNAAYEQVRDKVKEPYADLGEQVLKNIAATGAGLLAGFSRNQSVDGSPCRNARAVSRSAVHCRAAFHLFFRGTRVQISDGGDD